MKVEKFGVTNLIQIIERMRWVSLEKTQEIKVLISERCFNDLKQVGIELKETSIKAQEDSEKGVVEKIRLLNFYELWGERTTTETAEPVYSIVAFKDKTQPIKKFNQNEIERMIIFDFN